MKKLAKALSLTVTVMLMLNMFSPFAQADEIKTDSVYVPVGNGEVYSAKFENFEENVNVSFKNACGQDIKILAVLGFYDENNNLIGLSDYKAIDLKISEQKAVLFNTIKAPFMKVITVNMEKSGTLVDFEWTEGYADVPKDIEPYEAFYLAKEQLPKEIKVLKPFEVSGKTEIFVSNDGSDNNDGSIEKPFKTIEKAFDFVKNADKTDGIIIYLREGSYNNFNPLTVPAEISGTTDAPLFISAYKDEDVNIVGGASLPYEKFEKITSKEEKARLPKASRENVYQINLKELGIDKIPEIKGTSYGANLYINGETMTLARYPDTGLLPIETVIDQGPILNEGQVDDGRGVTIGFETFNRPLKWKDTGDIWVRGGFRWEWNQVYSPIKINYEENSFTTKYASKYGAEAGKEKFFYYNVFEELSQPGEYFIDRENMILYIYPIEPLEKGTKAYLTTFDETVVQIKDLRNVIFNKINFTSSSSNGILVKSSADVVFQNCVFSNFGDHGAFVEDSFRTGFLNCDFMKIRNRAIRMYNSTEATKALLIPNRNFIQNCTFFGNSDQILNSMISVGNVGSVISHNLFANGYATGLGMTSGAETVFEYNETVSLPKYQSDSGATYGGGPQLFATHVRYNYLHDAVKNPAIKPWSIYFDELGSYNYAYGNIMYNMNSGVFAHGGKGNAFTGNIFIDGVNGKGYTVNDGSDIYENPTASSNGFSNHLKQKYEIFKEWEKRYPYYANWLSGMNTLMDMIENDPDFEYGSDFENSLKEPSDGYYAKNISINSAGASDISTFGAVTAVGLDTNVTLGKEGYDNFVDYENKNFAIKENAPVLEQIEDFEIPDFERMGLLTGEGCREKPYIGMYGKLIAVYPANNMSCVYNEEINFKWSDITYANRYKFEIAKDKEFKNIIETIDTEYEYLTLALDGIGETYYWRVTAYTDAKSVDKTPYNSEVFKFTTMTKEELEENVIIDTSGLKEVVEKAVLWHDEMTEGENSGEYLKGTKDALMKLVNDAQEVIEYPLLKANVDKAIKTLEDGMIKLRLNEVYGYEDFDLDAENWISSGNTLTISNAENGNLVFSPVSGYPTAINVKQTKYRRMYRFKMKIDTLGGWWGITPIYDSAYGTRNWFVFKPDLLEVQKSKKGSLGPTGIIQDIENNLEILNSNTWHEIEMGVISVENGNWCYLGIDGKEIFSWVDDFDPNVTDGAMQFMFNAPNGKVEIAKSDLTDDKLPALKTKN